MLRIYFIHCTFYKYILLKVPTLKILLVNNRDKPKYPLDATPLLQKKHKMFRDFQLIIPMPIISI